MKYQNMTDREMIEKLGGTVLVAKYYGVTAGAVTNWKRRGMPKHVRALMIRDRWRVLDK